MLHAGSAAIGCHAAEHEVRARYRRKPRRVRTAAPCQPPTHLQGDGVVAPGEVPKRAHAKTRGVGVAAGGDRANLAVGKPHEVACAGEQSAHAGAYMQAVRAVGATQARRHEARRVEGHRHGAPLPHLTLQSRTATGATPPSAFVGEGHRQPSACTACGTCRASGDRSPCSAARQEASPVPALPCHASAPPPAAPAGAPAPAGRLPGQQKRWPCLGALGFGTVRRAQAAGSKRGGRGWAQHTARAGEGAASRLLACASWHGIKTKQHGIARRGS